MSLLEKYFTVQATTVLVEKTVRGFCFTKAVVSTKMVVACIECLCRGTVDLERPQLWLDETFQKSPWATLNIIRRLMRLMKKKMGVAKQIRHWF